MAQHAGQNQAPLGIVVVGASGDLAQRKVYPALFALYCQDLLPDRFQIYGMARSSMDQAAFRQRIAQNLTCRCATGAACAARIETFLARCHYVSGQYASVDAYLDLVQFMHQVEGRGPVNRLFYMAVPPTVFLDIARSLGNSGLIGCMDDGPWSRVVVEKPFGRDRRSSDELVHEMQRVFVEEMTYRIDHYLGKEVVQNLLVLRFANLVFEPIWNREFIESVTITWKEPVGVGQRGGYFDQFGIIRDVMQNHLLQILALLAMERPARFDAQAVRDAKVRLLRCIRPATLGETVVGQYGAGVDGRQRAYRDEDGVPADSRTATYAAAALGIDNARWQGVPFFLEAGKAMDERINEVRIRFRPVASNIFGDGIGPLEANELVLRVQPGEAIRLKIMNKIPGLNMAVRQTDLDLRYTAAFATQIPDAYECLLLDVLEGDRSLFIRADELEAAWDVFSPLLAEIEGRGVAPCLYPFGGGRPAPATELAVRHGVHGA